MVRPNSQSTQLRFTHWLHRHWQTRGWLSQLLLPLAWLNRGVQRLRRTAYQRQWLRTHWAQVPVVVVGNIYVGGTGKTPTLIALVQALRTLGWRPGVISRGYGAKAGAVDEPKIGTGRLAAEEFGDEPALIALATGVPVAVHRRRARAAAALCLAHPEVDVILADDGLQHLALGRDVELVVQDERGVGNGRLLPAGPLREPPERLQKVAAIVNHQSTPAKPHAPSASVSSATAAAESPHGVRRVNMHLAPGQAVRLHDGHQLELAALAANASRIIAIAGIGQPQRFFGMLRTLGLPLASTVALADHAPIPAQLLGELEADIILITDKDAVKCERLNDRRLWRVPVTAQFDDPNFVNWLDARLRAAPPTPNSPVSHGSTFA